MRIKKTHGAKFPMGYNVEGAISLVPGRLRANGRRQPGDLIDREATFFSMLMDEGFTRRPVEAVHLVFGDITVQPFDLRADLFDDRTGLLRNTLELVLGQRTGTRDRALDQIRGEILCVRNVFLAHLRISEVGKADQEK